MKIDVSNIAEALENLDGPSARPFGEWTKVFPDARLAKAVVDRLTHRSHIIDTGETSWRFKHGMKRQAAAKKGARINN